VRLDGLHVVATEDLEQIFIGNEVEAGRDELLGIQVVGQGFLATVKLEGDTLEFVETLAALSLNTSLEDVGLLRGDVHDLLVVCISLGELLGLFGKLHTDIVGGKNTFEIHPLALHDHP